jgi:hypothetical protein
MALVSVKKIMLVLAMVIVQPKEHVGWEKLVIRMDHVQRVT